MAQVPPTKITQMIRTGNGHLAENCGVILFPSQSQKLAPGQTREFPTASGMSAKDESQEVRMSPAVPKAQRQGEDQMPPVALGSLERTEGTDR